MKNHGHRDMQAGEKDMDTDSSKIQINGPSPPYKKYNSRRKILKNSNEFHGESEYKPTGNTLHHDHSEDQELHAAEKSGHKHFGEGKHHNHEQHEEMKHEQHNGSKHAVHEKHEAMKHEDYDPSRGRDHGNHHAHMLADFKKNIKSAREYCFINSLIKFIEFVIKFVRYCWCVQHQQYFSNQFMINFDFQNS
jgi:hypothetical protein